MGGMGRLLAHIRRERAPALRESSSLPRFRSVPAVILERSEESKRDYKSKDFTVFTYAARAKAPPTCHFGWGVLYYG